MNNFIDVIKNRRSVYSLNKNLPVDKEKIFDLVRNCVAFVPDAFDMQSQRVVVFIGKKHEVFWNAVYDELVKFTGTVFPRERIDSFVNAYGTILYFYDKDVVDKNKKQYQKYAEHFSDWVMQSNGMLQFAVWTGLRTLGVGANLQHYNPVIDKMAQNMFDLPESWFLVAQMPFGGIEKPADAKPMKDVSNRVIIER